MTKPTTMSFTLTDNERRAVTALKEACDDQGVEYKHNFELAKYVLVSHSAAKDSESKAAEIRLKTALNKLKKRNKWVRKHGLDNIDAHKALLEVAQETPGYFVNRYNTDKEGRVLVAHHQAHVPTVFDCKVKRANYHAAELYRMDLGAADLEEARRGIAIVSVNNEQLTVKRAFRYLKLVGAADHLKDMHPNRVKKLYAEVPSFLTYLVNPAKQLLPRKLAERITVVGSMDELHNHLDLADGCSVGEWATERLERYQETVEKLSLAF